MAIYRVTIAGRRKPVLVKADNITKAKDRIVTDCELLTADKLEEALTSGETVWREGDDLPADEAEVKPQPEGGECEQTE